LLPATPAKRRGSRAIRRAATLGRGPDHDRHDSRYQRHGPPVLRPGDERRYHVGNRLSDRRCTTVHTISLSAYRGNLRGCDCCRGGRGRGVSPGDRSGPARLWLCRTCPAARVPGRATRTGALAPVPAVRAGGRRAKAFRGPRGHAQPHERRRPRAARQSGAGMGVSARRRAGSDSRIDPSRRRPRRVAARHRCRCDRRVVRCRRRHRRCGGRGDGIARAVASSL